MNVPTDNDGLGVHSNYVLEGGNGLTRPVLPGDHSNCVHFANETL